MKLRTVGKLGVILSVILFCIGVGDQRKNLRDSYITHKF